MQNIVDEITAIDWTAYAGPDHYVPEEVPQALVDLLSLEDEQLNWPVYNRVLSAIGNNHCGTYHPAAEQALVYIIRTALCSDSEIARNCSLNILLDLYASFEPELGSYGKTTCQELEKAVQEQVESVEAELRSMSTSDSESDRNRQLADELVDCIDEAKRT